MATADQLSGQLLRHEGHARRRTSSYPHKPTALSQTLPKIEALVSRAATESPRVVIGVGEAKEDGKAVRNATTLVHSR